MPETGIAIPMAELHRRAPFPPVEEAV